VAEVRLPVKIVEAVVSINRRVYTCVSQRKGLAYHGLSMKLLLPPPLPSGAIGIRLAQVSRSRGVLSRASMSITIEGNSVIVTQVILLSRVGDHVTSQDRFSVTLYHGVLHLWSIAMYRYGKNYH
jgi:hypothetical protein